MEVRLKPFAPPPEVSEPLLAAIARERLSAPAAALAPERFSVCADADRE